MKIDINNPIINHPAISFNQSIERMQRKINNLQKIMMQKYKDKLQGKIIYLMQDGNILILNSSNLA